MVSRVSDSLSDKRLRKVYRVAAVYVGGSVAALGAADAALPEATWEAAKIPVVVTLLAGLPVALILAWVFEVRSRERGQGSISVDQALPSVPAAQKHDRAAPEADAPRRKSIVVLPFDNLSPDPGDAYFSDGLTEEIITDLSCCGLLRVISRNSAMVLKGTLKDTRDIAEQLGVQFVLEGSVRKAGEELRITAQLIDARADEHLWAEKYSGSMGDVFELQERVSRSVVEALTLRMTPEEEERFVRRPTEDVMVYECHLRARQEYRQMTPEGLDRARRQILNGLDLAGDNEVLFAAMGNVAMQRVALGVAPGPEDIPEAEEWAGRTFALNPDSPYGHALLGWIRYAQGRYREAVDHLRSAVELDPNNVDALFYLAVCYLSVGRPGAAGPVVQRLLAIDPLTAINYSLEGYWLLMRREFPEALASYRRVFEMYPDSVMGRVLYARSLALAGDEGEARKILSDTDLDPTSHIHAAHGVVLAHLLDGDRGQAESAITSRVEADSRYDGHLSWWMADWCSLLGKPKETVDWLRHASEIGFLNYPLVSELDRFLDPVRDHEDFRDFLEDLRRRWEEFQV